MLRNRSEAELLEEIDSLREQVRYWRGEAEAQISVGRRSRLQATLGLTLNEAWLLGALYAANGKPVSRARLDDGMPGLGGHRSERETPANVMSVIAHRVRRKLGEDVIETIRSSGYRIMPKGISICDAALAAAN